MNERIAAGEGLIAAALTPFGKGTVRVDYGRFNDQLRAIAAYQPLAVTVGAVESQEFQVLSKRSRLRLAEVAVETLPDVPVIAGVSSADLAESVALAKEVARRGATAVLAVAAPKPWGSAPTPDEAVEWFATLAGESPLPVVLYNNPRLGVDLSVETIARICELPNVIALKETSRDESKLLGLMKRVSGSGAVFTNMELLFSTLLLGGNGAMLPTPGLPVGTALTELVLKGDHERAARLALFFAEFPSRWMELGFLPVAKAAAELMGCDVGDPVRPYSGLDDDSRRRLRDYLAEWDLLDAFTRPGGFRYEESVK